MRLEDCWDSREWRQPGKNTGSYVSSVTQIHVVVALWEYGSAAAIFSVSLQEGKAGNPDLCVCMLVLKYNKFTFL